MVRTGDFFGFPCFTIKNGCLSLTVTEFGATALSLRFHGREMILGFDTLAEYEESDSCAGGIVGRFANRVGGAAFTLGGERYALCANERGNTLHGGTDGTIWHKRRWKGEICGENAVAFSLHSPDRDNGFPGELTARAVYTVTEKSVRIDFSGCPSKDTLYAPTSHIYFSLGEDNILGVQMQINASGHLDVDGALIPTGEILPTEGDFDFSSPRPIGRNFDDAFVLCSSPACVAQTDGVRLSLFTDYPVLQLYTGEFLDGKLAPNAGFAIEPEQYPDAPNKPQFPNAVVRAGESFSKYLEFVFEKI